MIDLILNILAAVYVLSGTLLSIFVATFGVLIVLYLLKRKQVPQAPEVPDEELLSVTVQLPLYNEQYVAVRLIDAVCQMDYPRDKFRVQILDDSTDETTTLCRERAEYWQSQGVDCQLVRRDNREGYKAGALAYGLSLTDSDCVAIFDADFVPPRDFLRRTMPHFNADSEIALIQTRWAHLNLDYNWLTRAQAINIDGHFAIEQVARSRAYLPMSMNGTGGIWRVKAIQDAGGWSAATLTEDLDLSYRALLRGWRFVYLVDVPVPGELPPQVAAWKIQQARWATGSTQCLIRHAVPLLRSHFPVWKKIMGIAHLSQYAVQPLIFLLFVLTPILLLGDKFDDLPDLRIVGVFGIIPPILLILGQTQLYRNWWQNLFYFPIQFVSGAAIVLSNTLAVLKAINIRKELEFKRTPKFRVTSKKDSWTGGRYALHVDWTTVGELTLSVYAAFGAYLAMNKLAAVAPYMVTYAISFAAFAYWNYYQTRKVRG
jgi:cellulose synthase/poly-beta-1,6-N-acetylglucosamine synthase-like glycosyltransferase